MTTAAIIAEFNPLHSGHEYIINEARRLTGADCIVIVLSGSFTQRGDIAIAPKRVRAAAAVACGADIVFELPFAYATSSAEFFAMGAAALLEALGGIDYLVFGAENADISMLSFSADILLDEPDIFKQTLNSCLKKGMSFPAARERAFISCGGPANIFTPNNTLAIEYIKALKNLSSSIHPVAVSRCGLGYNEEDYSSGSGFISASAFRSRVAGLSSDDALNSFLSETLPSASANLLMSSHKASFPIYNDDMLLLLRYAIITHRTALNNYADFTDALANRVNRLLDREGCALFSGSYEDFILRLKTRDMTASRIKRAMLHLLTGYTNEAQRDAVKLLRAETLSATERSSGELHKRLSGKLSGKFPYARLLALSSSGQGYLSSIKKGCDATIINSLGRSMPELSESGRRLIQFDILSSDIYSAVVSAKFHHELADEYRAGVVRLLR